MPDNFGDELHDGEDDVSVHRHIKHPGDTVRVQHVAMPISLLIKQRSLSISGAGHCELDVVVDRAGVEGVETAQGVGSNRLWPLLYRFFGENTGQPLPEPLQVLPVIVVEANHIADYEGGGGLEGAVVGESGGGDDEQVEEKTERGETDDDPGDDAVDSVKVVG